MLETVYTEIKSSEHIPPKFVDVVKKAGGGKQSFDFEKPNFSVPQVLPL